MQSAVQSPGLLHDGRALRNQAHRQRDQGLRRLAAPDAFVVPLGRHLVHNGGVPIVHAMLPSLVLHPGSLTAALIAVLWNSIGTAGQRHMTRSKGLAWARVG